MAKTYPHKQTLAIFIVCFIFVTGIAIYIYGWPSTKNAVKYRNSNLEPQVATNNTNFGTSSDWQKQFIDTKASTTFKYDPVTQKNIEVEVPLNPTEALGRDFFTKYVELRQSGLNNDQKAVDTVATQLIKEGVAKVSQPKSYTSKDIVIIPVGTTVDATKLYAENLVKILKSWMPVKNEAEIAMEAFEKGDMDLLKGIDPIILGYKTALTKLLATPVVQPLAESHLDLINAISLQAFNAKGLRNSDEDPLTGLAAISLEIKSLEAIATAIGKMQSHFASSGIVFNLPISGSILQSQ
jgi:hypothetical protein